MIGSRSSRAVAAATSSGVNPCRRIGADAARLGSSRAAAGRPASVSVEAEYGDLIQQGDARVPAAVPINTVRSPGSLSERADAATQCGHRPRLPLRMRSGRSRAPRASSDRPGCGSRPTHAELVRAASSRRSTAAPGSGQPHEVPSAARAASAPRRTPATHARRT